MCSLSLRDFMVRPGTRLYGWISTLSLWTPNPACSSIRQGPTDTDVGTAHQADAARGWASGGPGDGLSPPRGGARSPAPARRPSKAAGALKGAGWSVGCHSLVGRDTGGRRDCQVPGPRTEPRERKGFTASPPAPFLRCLVPLSLRLLCPAP